MGTQIEYRQPDDTESGFLRIDDTNDARAISRALQRAGYLINLKGYNSPNEGE